MRTNRGSKRGERAAEMHRLIEEFERVGSSQAAFCRAHGLAMSTFLYWRRRAAEARRQAFVEVEIAPSAKLGDDHRGIEVVLPGGVIVRIGTDTDEAAIRRVLRAAGAPC